MMTAHSPALPTSGRATRTLAFSVVTAVSIALGAAPCAAVAQGTELTKAVSIEELQLSSAPAFVLLGAEPTTIQRPGTPRALRTTLLAAAADSGGIPRNLALEVTPYWLRRRPAFTPGDYFKGSPIARTASVALATTPHAGDGGEAGTAIALSVRSMLVTPGKPAGFDQTLAGVEDGLGQCVAREAAALVQQCYDSLNSGPIQQLREMIRHPQGFALELAFGASADWRDNVAESMRGRRLGAWLTPTFAISDRVDFVGVVRGLREFKTDTVPDHTLVDYGVRLVWQAGDDFALSGEVVGRQYASGTSGQTARYGALAQYRIGDRAFLFYALGKDFAAKDAPRSRLLSAMGLNFGLGDAPRVKLK